MARRFTRMRVSEVSSVDKGAGEGVKVLLAKRDAAVVPPVKKAWLSEVLAKAGSLIGMGKAEDFATAQAAIETGEFAADMIDEVQEAIQALQASVCSIMGDDTITDKQAAVATTFSQFKDHVQGIVPEGVEEAMRGAALAAAGYTIDDQGAVSKREGIAVTDVEKKAAEDKAKADEAEKEALKKALAVQKREIAVLKMSDKHKAYLDKSDMSADDKDKFVGMEPAQRDAHIEKNPLPGEVEKRQAETINAAIAKALESHPEVVTLRKRLADMEAQSAAGGFQKMATDNGLPAEVSATIMKAMNGDKTAVAELVKQAGAGWAAAEAAGAFREVGSRVGKAGDSFDTLTAKAAEYRKAHPELSEAQAFAKVYEDPANADIAKAERRANRPA